MEPLRPLGHADLWESTGSELSAIPRQVAGRKIVFEL